MEDKKEALIILKWLLTSLFVLFSIFSWVKLYTATVDPVELVEVKEPMIKTQRGTEEMPVSEVVQQIVNLLETPRETATTTN